MLLLNSDKKKMRTEISTEIMNKQAVTDWEEPVGNLIKTSLSDCLFVSKVNGSLWNDDGVQFLSFVICSQLGKEICLFII